VTHFETIDGLLGFMDRVLSAVGRGARPEA